MGEDVWLAVLAPSGSTDAWGEELRPGRGDPLACGVLGHRRHGRLVSALRGYWLSCEIQFDGFVFLVVNEIASQLAKMRHRFCGTLSPSGGDLHPVRRRHRRGRAPQRVSWMCCSCTGTACAWSPARTRLDASAMIQAARSA